MENYSNIETIDSLIGKYLSGNCASHEAEELMNWLNASDDNRKYFTQFKIIWLQSGLENDKSTDNRWEQLQMRIEGWENNVVNQNNLADEIKNHYLRIFSYAAVILGFIGISAFFYYLLQKRTQPFQLTENVIEVPYGSKMNLTLPDNSKVWINSGSKLTFNNRFGIDNREIEITGEAYFDVAKNPDLPFIVHAGKVDIKALGTAFNVKAYPEDNRIETTLVHGAVEVKQEGKKKEILLKPKEKIIILDKETVSLTSNLTEDKLSKEVDSIFRKPEAEVVVNKLSDIEKETAWKDDKLIFNQEPLETLTVQLMRRYDVNFEFEDYKLKMYRFTGTFKDLTLEQIMDAIKFSSPIDYEIKEKKVILKTKLE